MLLSSFAMRLFSRAHRVSRLFLLVLCIAGVLELIFKFAPEGLAWGAQQGRHLQESLVQLLPRMGQGVDVGPGRVTMQVCKVDIS